MRKYNFLPIAVLIIAAGSKQNLTTTAKVINQQKLVSHQITPAAAGWTGSWERRVFQDGAGLDITSQTANTFSFDLEAYSGGHTGEIEGIATFAGTTAVYIDQKVVKGCKLNMHLLGDSVIEIKDNNTCIKYGGMGVAFSGRFVNKKYLPEEKPQTLISLKILTPAQDVVFRKLVDTAYQRFVDCTEMIEDRSGEKSEEFGMKVIVSGVRGLYMYMEYIIMIDSNNHIFAAVIDNGKVLYYTNLLAYTGKLPQTIEQWRSRFKDYPVIYKSKS